RRHATKKSEGRQRPRKGNDSICLGRRRLPNVGITAWRVSCTRRCPSARRPPTTGRLAGSVEVFDLKANDRLTRPCACFLPSLASSKRFSLLIAVLCPQQGFSQLTPQ
ncbi:unnamed protein product, partial [Phaeothamnion confervicola]